MKQKPKRIDWKKIARPEFLFLPELETTPCCGDERVYAGRSGGQSPVTEEWAFKLANVFPKSEPVIRFNNGIVTQVF